MLELNKSKEQRGFSLIEVAVIIIILSLVITPLFALLNKQRKQDTIKKDVATFERALGALGLFVRENARYPCPADETVPQDAANFGQEDCSLGTVTGIPAANGNVIIGTLPVRTLNLSYRDAVNSNDWKYIYAVTQDLTQVANYDGIGAIQVVDASDADLLGKPAHFVIVDPGEDGKGTTNLFGSDSSIHAFGACPASGTRPLDSENCDNDAQFRDADFAMKFPATHHTYYDDGIVYTLTRSETTMWMVKENTSDTSAAALDIVNRNIGNVGIGTDAPNAKLHISGGNVRIQGEEIAPGDFLGGDLLVEQSVFVSQSIRADENIEAMQLISSGNNIEVEETVTSKNMHADELILSSGNIVAGEEVSGKNIEASEDVRAGANIIANENVEAGNDISAGDSITSPVFYYE